MNPLQKLIDERDRKVWAAQNLIEGADKDGNRPLTPDEFALFDKLEGEIKDLGTRIESLQQLNDRTERLNALQASLAQPAPRRAAPDLPGNPSPVSGGDGGNSPLYNFRIPATARKARTLKAFKGPDADHRAYKVGMWARATLLKDERAAHWCVTHGLSNALGTTPNSSGGNLIPEELSSAIIDLREQYGVFRRNCNVVPMSRDTITIPRRLGGITIGPLGENPSAGPTESSPTWNNVTLTAKKAGGLTKMSTEVAEDAIIDLGDWVADEYAYSFALFEDQCGFIGDGTSTYLGIRGLTNLMTITLGLAGAVACVTAGHDIFSEVDVADLAALMGRLPEFARMNAKFYCSSVAAELIFGRLQATAGGNTVETLSNGQTRRAYLGYPIEISQVLPSGAATDYSGLPFLFFGDLKKSSSLGDRREVRIFVSEHRYMETDQIGIFGSERVDIVNHDLGTTTVAGPMVALCGGAS